MPSLRVLCGPDPAHMVPITHLVNTNTPVKIKSDAFEGWVVANIKGFSGDRRGGGNEEYFDREDRKGVTWSIQVQGRFLQPHSADDILFGNTFERALHLPWGSGAALKFMNYLDPTLTHDLTSPTKPWALSPLVSTMPHFAHTNIRDGDRPVRFPSSRSLKDDNSSLPLAFIGDVECEGYGVDGYGGVAYAGAGGGGYAEGSPIGSSHSSPRSTPPSSASSSSSSLHSASSATSYHSHHSTKSNHSAHSNASHGSAHSAHSTHSTHSHGSAHSHRSDGSHRSGHSSGSTASSKIKALTRGTTSRGGGNIKTSAVNPPVNLHTASHRRAYFSDRENRKRVVFGPEDIITTDFCYGFLQFSPSLTLKLPGGVGFDLMRYWDGQPVRFCCCERKRNEREGDGVDDNGGRGDRDPWGRVFWCVAIEMAD